MSGIPRLTSAIEASALRRRAEADGGSATVLKRGDDERGALLLLVASRGTHIAAMERVSALDGSLQWQMVGPAEGTGAADIDHFLANRKRIDDDLWIIELDVADPQRFIAETVAVG